MKVSDLQREAKEREVDHDVWEESKVRGRRAFMHAGALAYLANFYHVRGYGVDEEYEKDNRSG